ncbi:MAPEG family protein [Polyangium aurulentum]|uniref:MAPEG family protein n=1 Tax=Polyangium aurulentum TaxID=2567896 RepID=UPI0010AE351E|nr:MAPEG family protein [Polyangium aurulentum]UQA61084.1 MAPEG family protein [Polyangium aurulentum]
MMPPTFEIWVASLVVLFFKMHFNSAMQKRGRDAAGAYPRPEDARMFNMEVKEDTGLAWRAGRCWQNDLENIPLYLFLSLAYVLAGGPEPWAYILFGAFTLARVLHTVFYLRAAQPWRFLSYTAGHLAQLGIVGILVYRLFVA